jgi:hypothetical protein
LEDYKAYLVKTKPNGDTEWTRTYGGTNYDVGYSVQQTDDGGYIVAGITGSYGAGLDDLYLIKTDAYGDTLWTRTCGGTDMDQGYSVQQTADGGYVACGCTFSPSAPSESDIYIVKTDAHGNTLWARTYGDSGIDRCFSVQQTTDGGFILAGETVPLGAYQYDVYIVRTDSTGDVLWSKTYGGPSADRSSAVKRTADGGYVIAGRSNSFGIGDYDIYLIKTDSLGNVGVAEPRRPQAASPKLQAEPNPCRSSTVLRWTPGPLDPSTPVLRVFDATGRLVLSQPVRTSPFPLSTSGLAAGAYFLRVSSGGRAASTRLVVTR